MSVKTHCDGALWSEPAIKSAAKPLVKPGKNSPNKVRRPRWGVGKEGGEEREGGGGGGGDGVEETRIYLHTVAVRGLPPSSLATSHLVVDHDSGTISGSARSEGSLTSIISPHSTKRWPVVAVPTVSHSTFRIPKLFSFRVAARLALTLSRPGVHYNGRISFYNL